MSKIIETGSDSRTKLLSGVEQLANAVVTTLGPNGRNVVIAQQGGMLPQSTKDGVTVAKTVTLKDPVENLGAQMVKQAAVETGNVAGDGTTTSTLLAKELIKEGMKHTNLSQKHNAVAIKRGMDKTAKEIVKYLKEMSTDIASEEQIKQVKPFVDYFSTARTEYFNIDYDTHVVQLEQSPIVSVTSVHERSSQADAYILLEKDGSNGKYDYHIDTDTDSIFRTTDETYKNWQKGVAAVKVIYKAGYASTPEDLKLAAYDLVTYYLKDEYKSKKTIAGATIDNQTSSTLRGNVGFPDHIKRVLDMYKMT